MAVVSRNGAITCRRSRRLRLGVAAGPVTVLLVALICAACGSTGARHGGIRVRGLGGAFAGYVWQAGTVTSVSASWRVPTIDESAAGAPAVYSDAATWIGAQAGVGGPDEPFIQIGTTETLGPSGSDRDYDAFWSDAHRGFHPQRLLAVRPGDAMTATMWLAHGRWRLSIVDTTRRLHRQVTTREESAGRFNLALWLQENPTDDRRRRTPYPTLSGVRMSALRVNGTAPVSDDPESTWMELPHEYLGPTPLRADAFTIVPHTLSAAGARYLRATASFDTAAGGYDDQRAGWTARTSAATVRRETDTFIAALVANVDDLRAGPWPTDVAAPVRSLLAIYAPQIPQLRRTAGRGERAVASLMERFHSLGEIVDDDALVRQGLGLPQTQY